MNSIEAREISRAEYSAFLARVPHPVFHRLEWLAAVETGRQVLVTPVGFFRAAELVAVSPVLKRRIGPVRIWGSPLRKTCIPPATPFCSPTSLVSECVPAMRAWMRQRHIHYLQLTVCGDVVLADDVRTEPLSNLELDLTRPLAAIWKSVVDVQRTCVRKAVRFGVRVHWSSDTGLLFTQQELIEATYGTQGLNPNIPRWLYAELYARRDKNNLHVLHATHKGRVIASVWLFHDDRKCYYWDAAARREAREFFANHLLLWCLTRWAHRNGFATLDCVGTAIGGRAGSRPGIGHFKQSMGARPVQYQILYWHTPLLHAALNIYRWLRRARKVRQRKQ